jgi:hypothetical protein
MYFQMFTQLKKELGQLDKWLAAAEAHAQARKFDAHVFLTVRLSPDQFPLVRQVQSTCDTAKLGAARLTGKDAPSHPDTETSLAELQTRVRAVIEYLDGYSEADFAGTTERLITTPRWEGKVMTGADYFHEHVVPNFFFHLTHTYALLRHNGVPLGKKDYLGTLTQRMP